MTFFKDERKNDSVYAKGMSFFNDHWNMRSWEISVSQDKSEWSDIKGKLATINKKQELTESFFAFGVKRGAYGTKVVLIQGQKWEE